jgi:Uma2 family endonuclease
MVAKQARKPKPDALPQRRRFTADEYERMIEVGILRKEERVELLEGEVFCMAAIGPRHQECVDRTTHWFRLHLPDNAILRVQGSFRQSETFEPQPDILILRYRDDFYRSRLPNPEDVLLLIEVADSSLAYDRNTKSRWYASANIREFWIEDVKGDCIHVFRSPSGDRYRDVFTARRGETIAPLAFPELTLSLDDLLGAPPAPAG